MHEIGIHDRAMTGYVEGVLATGFEQSIKSARPCRGIGAVVDRRVGGLFDEIAAEDNAAISTLDDRDQVVVGVAATQVADGNHAFAEIDDVRFHLVLGPPQRGNGLVDVARFRAVQQGL